MDGAWHRTFTAILWGASLYVMYECNIEGPEPYYAASLGFVANMLFVHSDLDQLESHASASERLFSVLVHLAIFGLAVWAVAQANPGLDLLEFFEICRWIR